MSSRKIVQRKINNDNVVNIFDNVSEARDSLGIKTVSNISKCLAGKRATAHGSKWQYVDDEKEIRREMIEQRDDDEEEVWKDIRGFVGKYRVSDRGNIHGVSRKRNLAIYHDKTKGYYYVTLQGVASNSIRKVQDLVAEAFIENPNNLTNVRHIDGDVSNNKIENLEWC